MMKKILLTCLLLFVFMANVSAENKLYFTNNGKELVYDSGQFEEKIFMNHLELYPGEENEDILIIENGTNTTCELYFKIIEKEQSELADEILDNIEMKIYLDDILFYDGTARGENIIDDGINLLDTIYIGEYKKDTTSKLVVKTKFNQNFTKFDKNEISENTWEFYGKCGEGSDIEVINPDTVDPFVNKIFYVLIASAVVTLFIFAFYKNRMLLKK